MRFDRFIPSMYQRRLLLIAVVMTGAGLLPLLQVARLTTVKADELREDAERRLRTETFLATERGRIIDRKGRVVALDRPSFDIAIDYSVITGEWVHDTARERARRAAGTAWSSMGRERRQELASAQEPMLRTHLEQAWQLFAKTGGLSLEELNKRKAEVRDQVEYVAALVRERARLKEQSKVEEAGDTKEVLSADIRVTVQEERESHVLLREVPDSVGFEFEKLAAASTDDDAGDLHKPLAVIPGLRVRQSSRRDYPLDEMDVPIDRSTFPTPIKGGAAEVVRVEGVGTHVVGWMRNRIVKEDLQRRPKQRTDGSIDLGHYRPGDGVGQGGVEFACEDQLRGARGMQIKHLDTREVDTTAPSVGHDVKLTIDMSLQARVQALFHEKLGLAVVQPWHRTARPEDEAKPKPTKELPVGTKLNGAVVVIEVDSGDIIAMASLPSFTHHELERSPEKLLNDEYNLTYLNRAIDRPYMPGSIVKPLIFCAANAAGKVGLDERIQCTGHFFPDKPLMYRCWIYKQFHTTHSAQLGHDPAGWEAIKGSCNIYFFELGRRLGTSGISDLFTSLGVGAAAQPFNLYRLPSLPELPAVRKLEQSRRVFAGEARGSVPAPDKATAQEAILMGIGQGPIVWTPLHAANAYAALARGGDALTPRIFAEGPGSEQKRESLGFPASAIDRALKGLRGSANEENGTTYTVTTEDADGHRAKERIFNTPGIDIWAKSGTADTNPFKADLDESGGREEYDGDHSWCVLLAGVDGEPKYAIAVVIDYGGSGGRVAGPMANQVVHALVDEGYLPDRRPDATGRGPSTPETVVSRSRGGRR
jgi:penicillin-binding protein 2